MLVMHAQQCVLGRASVEGEQVSKDALHQPCIGVCRAVPVHVTSTAARYLLLPSHTYPPSIGRAHRPAQTITPISAGIHAVQINRRCGDILCNVRCMQTVLEMCDE